MEEFLIWPNEVLKVKKLYVLTLLEVLTQACTLDFITSTFGYSLHFSPMVGREGENTIGALIALPLSKARTCSKGAGPSQLRK